MDELRIESAMRSTNWAWASWMTVVSNSVLASYSSVVQQPLAISIAGTGKEELVCWPAHGVGATLPFRDKSGPAYYLDTGHKPACPRKHPVADHAAN
jgi:hypothetical protein